MTWLVYGIKLLVGFIVGAAYARWSHRGGARHE